MKHLKSYNESIEEEVSKEDYERVSAILQSEMFDEMDIVREDEFDFGDYLHWGIAKNIWIGGIKDVDTAKSFERQLNELKPLIEEMTNITFEVKIGEYASKIFGIENISYVTIHLETIDSYSGPDPKTAS